LFIDNYLNRLVFTLQFYAKHLLGGECPWLYVSIDWCIHCNWMQNTSSVENGHGCMSQSIGVYIAIGCKTPPRWRMVMAVCLNRLLYTLRYEGRTPPRGRMVMAVCLNRLLYTLQLDAKHLLGGEWSWLYVSIDWCIHCIWMQNTSSVENGHGCMSQLIGVYIAI